MKLLFNDQVKSPLSWYGGKTLMLDFLLPLMGRHRRYVEPFSGSWALGFNKPPSQLDVYNDADEGLVNFMQVVQDPALSEQLIAALYLTQKSRQEHESCKRNYPARSDRVEWARQFFVLVRQSRSGIFGNTWGYGITTTGGNFHSAIKLIRPASARLRHVCIHNLHFRDLLPMYDGPDTLIYLDPPYLSTTRESKKVYQHEMSVADHVELLAQIKQLHGMVLLSGYPSKLYNESLADWFHVDHAVPCYCAPNKTKGDDNHKPYRLERVWMNLRAHDALENKNKPRPGGGRRGCLLPSVPTSVTLASAIQPTTGQAPPFAMVVLPANLPSGFATKPSALPVGGTAGGLVAAPAVAGIFRYYGGKSSPHIRKLLLGYAPLEYASYREAFVGGGGLYFAIDPAKARWINDINPDLMAVYNALHDRPDEFIALCRSILPAQPGEPTTPRPKGTPINQRLRELFYQFLDDPQADRALRYFFLNRTSFEGRVVLDPARRSRTCFTNPAGWNIVSGPALEKAAARLHDTHITCGDFEDIFTAPGDNVFIYSDAPYVRDTELGASSKLYEYGFTMADHERLASVVRRSPHQVLMSYDDHPRIRELYAGDTFRIHEAEWTYCNGKKKERRVGRELIITNYAVLAQKSMPGAEIQLIPRDSLTIHEPRAV